MHLAGKATNLYLHYGNDQYIRLLDPNLYLGIATSFRSRYHLGTHHA